MSYKEVWRRMMQSDLWALNLLPVMLMIIFYPIIWYILLMDDINKSRQVKK